VKVYLTTAPASIKEAAAISATDQHQHSVAAQMLNGVSHQGGKLASYEPDYWRLDGSFMLPVEHFNTQMEVGYASSSISDAQGNFAIAPRFDISFETPQNMDCLSLVFDAATGETADTISIWARGADNMTAFSETIVGNRDVVVSTKIGGENVSHIVIMITKTARPFRRARVAEIHFGHVLAFDGEDIVEVNNLRQADALGRNLPANRLHTRIINKGRFSLLDEAGEIRHLKDKCLVEHVHGVFIGNRREWTHCGNFLLSDFAVHENHVDITAHGRVMDLAAGVYMQSSFQLFTLGAIARHVAADAGVAVRVPPVMDNSPTFLRFFGNVSHRAALGAIAQMASCLLYEDNFGVLNFVDATEAPRDLADNLDYEKMFAQPRIGLGAYYNGVLLRERMLKIEPGTVTVTQEVWGAADIKIPFDRPIFSDGWAQASNGFALTNVVFHAMYMTARLQGNGVCTLQIHGNRSAFSENEVFYPAPWYEEAQGKHPYTVDLPNFLHNVAHIAALRSWFLRRKFAMLAKRMVCEAVWRQNPTLAPGDGVSMQVDRDGKTLVGHVLRQEMNFSRGVLRGGSSVVME